MGCDNQDGRLVGCRVLIVEDDFLIADDFTRRLLAAGAHILGPAATLDSARALCEQHPAPDVAVLDVNLRGTLVFPLAEQLERDGIPFLFCTGYGDDPMAGRFKGVTRFEKPLSHQAFSHLIGELAEMHRRLRPPASRSGPAHLPM